MTRHTGADPKVAAARALAQLLAAAREQLASRHPHYCQHCGAVSHLPSDDPRICARCALHRSTI